MPEYSDYIRCRRDERELVANKQVAFGFNDAKGREIGYSVLIDRELWVADGASYSLWKPGFVGRPIWVVMPSAMRDGTSYGATPNAKVCLTEEEALEKADAMIAAYRKKMAKQFA
ncbi:MAG: hypothetical protein RLZ51_1871 [Pseudomonadota bacterium]|jgi:hypothetical protein